jgi:hypothetical protein
VLAQPWEGGRRMATRGFCASDGEDVRHAVLSKRVECSRDIIDWYILLDYYYLTWWFGIIH